MYLRAILTEFVGLVKIPAGINIANRVSVNRFSHLINHPDENSRLYFMCS
jgi:hypothetical protein